MRSPFADGRGTFLALAAVVTPLAACGDDSSTTRSDASVDGTAADVASLDARGDHAAPTERFCDTDFDCPALPDGAPACAVIVCAGGERRCVLTGLDQDGDGKAGPCDLPVAPAGVLARRGTDCDDQDPRRWPGNVEVCDPALDEDCNEETVAGPAGSGDGDADGDGFASVACGNRRDGSTEVIAGPDCDDANPSVHPGASDGPAAGCNGVDDDCDGVVDRGCSCSASQPCGGAPDGTHDGDPAVCRRGVQRCVDGVLGDCEGAVGPGIEVCDPERRDEDCDGVSNEPDVCECTSGETRLCGAAGVDYGPASACRHGTETCAGGRWGVCEGSVGPAPAELCGADHVDENCDGSVDEGCACVDGGEQPCGGSPLGLNAPPATCVQGHQTCSGGTWGACVGAVGPGTEVCDVARADEDCDGTSNEPDTCDCTDGSEALCGGGPVNIDPAVCRFGRRTCSGGRYGLCLGSVEPGVEVCDGAMRDEDCDGMVNEGCRIVGISAGLGFSCALRESGVVDCWGDNSRGQLGIGGGMPSSVVPVQVPGLASVVAIDSEWFTTCARKMDGTVWCWGALIGGGSPTMVPGITDAIDVAVEEQFQCLIRRGGVTLCWGANTAGQLGNGSAMPADVPVPVTGLSDGSHIAAGGGQACAVRSTGAVACWGLGYSGDGTPLGAHLTPVAVPGLTARDASLGGATCATDGTLRCWGENGHGQVGDGSTTSRTTPVSVPLGVTYEVGAGAAFTCAVETVGRASCWGLNTSGQLGDGSTVTDRSTPGLVSGLPDPVELAAGLNHVCARRALGTVVCWGDDAYGQLGDGRTATLSRTPVTVVGLPY